MCPFHPLLTVSLNYSSGVFRAFQGLCINEFTGLKFDHQDSFDVETGEQVIGLHGFQYFMLQLNRVSYSGEEK